LFRKGGEARLHIERFIDAGVLNEAVEFESGIIAAARMGEDVLEGVHRSVSRERSRATPSRIPWMSATRMLQANLEYFNKLMTTPGSGALWRSEWQRYKKLLQVPHKGCSWTGLDESPTRSSEGACIVSGSMLFELGVASDWWHGR
jgi:hypothetical protein